MPLPPSSPDLNPIENVWFLLKRRTSQRFLVECPSTVEDIVRISQEEWEEVNWALIDRMIEGMPRRIESVIAVEGARTQY
jgi:hypothetical protein